MTPVWNFWFIILNEQGGLFSASVFSLYKVVRYWHSWHTEAFWSVSLHYNAQLFYILFSVLLQGKLPYKSHIGVMSVVVSLKWPQWKWKNLLEIRWHFCNTESFIHDSDVMYILVVCDLYQWFLTERRGSYQVY